MLIKIILPKNIQNLLFWKFQNLTFEYQNFLNWKIFFSSFSIKTSKRESQRQKFLSDEKKIFPTNKTFWENKIIWFTEKNIFENSNFNLDVFIEIIFWKILFLIKSTFSLMNFLVLHKSKIKNFNSVFKFQILSAYLSDKFLFQ